MTEKTFRQTKIFLLTKIMFIDFPLMIIMVGFFTLLVRVLRFLNAKLTLKEKTILLQGGIINKGDVEIPYSKINSVSVRQGLLGSFFGYGDIVITTGNDISGIPFKGIKNPQYVKQLINSKIS